MIAGNHFHTLYTEILLKMEKESILFAKMKMIDHLSFTLDDPTQSLVNLRKNWAWALHEGINRLSFKNIHLANPGTAYQYRPNWERKLKKEGGLFCYSYGDKYETQVPWILKMLKSKSSREAIITVWDTSYSSPTSQKSIPRRPCTLTLHFYFFNGKLNCSCNMRTVDVMNMLPYDVFHHTLLQRYIASVLGVDLGKFHFTASFAYYQKKRDTTGSVKNTINKLMENPVLDVEENWLFTDNDRKKLMVLTEVISNEGVVSVVDLELASFSAFGEQYAKALLYLYKLKVLKLKHKVELKEFEVIYT